MSVISIIGMHRSGTSCLTGSLQSGGLFSGEVVEFAPFNKKGNRENLEIRSINDEVLAYSGGAWNNPPKNIVWSRGLSKKRDRIIKKFYKRADVWLFKDPRTTLTLPFWREGINELINIGIFRNPIEVAQSLEQRGKIRKLDSIRLWCIYNEKLIKYYSIKKFPILIFNSAQNEFLKQVEKVVEWLMKEVKNKVQLKFDLCRNFYDLELIHHESCNNKNEQIYSLNNYLSNDIDLAHRALNIYLELTEINSSFEF